MRINNISVIFVFHFEEQTNLQKSLQCHLIEIAEKICQLAFSRISPFSGTVSFKKIREMLFDMLAGDPTRKFWESVFGKTLFKKLA